jgi:hypothetical protein
VIDSLIAGAAIGIISCLGGQGVMMKLNNSDARKLGARVEQLETREVVLKDQDFIGRKEVQQALDGMAQVMQQALVEQSQGLQQMIVQSSQKNAQAVRVAEARAQAVAPMQPQANTAQVQELLARFEQMERQIGG